MKVKYGILLMIMGIILLFNGCNFSISTAKVTDVVPCKSVDEEGKPVDPQDVFSTEDKIMYVSAKTANVPADTEIKIIWYYVDKNNREKIDEINLKLDTARYIKTYLKTDTNFPAGSYEAEFYINDRSKPDKVAKITVK